MRTICLINKCEDNIYKNHKICFFMMRKSFKNYFNDALVVGDLLKITQYR